MPTPPFASALVSRNGGGNQSGGITGSVGDVAQLQLGSTQAFNVQRWDLVSVPPGYTVPASWLTDTDGTFYSLAATPPPFSLSIWGKYAVRLRVGDALTNKDAAAQLTDVTLSIDVVSPGGLHDLAKGETNQFGPDWTTHQKLNLRIIESGLFASGGPPSGAAGGDWSGNFPTGTNIRINGQRVPWKSTVKVASTSNISLTGEQTIDGVLTSASRVAVMHQTTASQNGLYVTEAGAWARASDMAASADALAGTKVYVSEGTLWANTTWTLGTQGSITLGSTSLVFTPDKVQTVAALRLCRGFTDGQRTRLICFSALGDGGGGEFYWNSANNNTTRPDNGGTIIVPTGLATGCWERQYSGALHANWFGAAADLDIALNAAIAALPSAGGTIDVRGVVGTISATVSFAKPVIFLLDGAQITTTVAPAFESTAANFALRGGLKKSTKVTATSGTGTLIRLTGNFDATPGTPHLEIEGIEWVGKTGLSLLYAVGGTDGLSYFQEGRLEIAANRIADFGDSGIHLDISTNFVDIHHNFIYNCGEAIFTGLNTDGAIYKNTTYASTTSPGITVVGPNTRVYDNHLAHQSQAVTMAPLRMYARESSAGGFLPISGNKWLPENAGLTDGMCGIEIVYGGDATAAPSNIRLGPNNVIMGAYAFLIATIAGNGTTATVTLDSARAHGIAPTTTATVWIQDSPGYNGLHTVTAHATDPLKFTFLSATNTTVHVGYALPGNNSAIRLTNPAKQLVITGNTFQNWRYLVEDAQSLTAFAGGECQLDASNTVLASTPHPTPWTPFKNGGRQFSRIALHGAIDPFDPNAHPRPRKAQNRLGESEHVDNWSASGVTFTASQTDPLGTSRAFKLTRDGSAQAQQIQEPVDVASGAGGALGTSIIFSVWLKAGTLTTVDVSVYDETDNAHTTLQSVSIDTTWRQYKVRSGVNAAHAYNVILYPGGIDGLAGDLYIAFPQASDAESDYVPTFAYDTGIQDTVSARFEEPIRSPAFYTAPQDGTTKPTISTITGTFTGGSAVEDGSTDLAGTLLMATPSSASSNNGTVEVTYAKAYTGNAPVVVVREQSGASAWAAGSGAKVLSSTVSAFTFQWVQTANLDDSSSYRFAYFVVGR